MYIVTGGLGFIGSNLVRSLDNAGIRVVVADYPQNIKAKYKNISGCKNVVDIVHPEKVFAQVSNAEGVFHLGANSNTMDFSDSVLKDNFDYSKKLVQACIKEHRSFVYASSAAVYGDRSVPVTEEDDTSPLNLYAFTKQMFDNYVANKRMPRGCKIIGLRYFNVYGYGESHKGKMASFIYQKYQQAKKEGLMTLFSPGDQSRDFIHVDDVVRITLNAMMMHQFESGIYNVGTGVSTTFKQVVEEIKHNIEDEVALEYIDFPAELVGRYQPYTCADISKLRAALPDYKFKSLSEGIAELIEAYEEEACQ